MGIVLAFLTKPQLGSTKGKSQSCEIFLALKNGYRNEWTIKSWMLAFYSVRLKTYPYIHLTKIRVLSTHKTSKDNRGRHFRKKTTWRTHHGIPAQFKRMKKLGDIFGISTKIEQWRHMISLFFAHKSINETHLLGTHNQITLRAPVRCYSNQATFRLRISNKKGNSYKNINSLETWSETANITWDFKIDPNIGLPFATRF